MTVDNKGHDDLHIWWDFLTVLKTGQMTVDRIRPYEQMRDEWKPVLLDFLDSVRKQAIRDDWEATPEVVRTDDRVHFIVAWGAEKVSYCFSFITEDSRWVFQHLESIFIRLDQVSELPASEFPDVSEAQKNWAREETYWSFVILQFYLPIAAEKGKQHALDMLKDGAGYFIGARAWVPFLPPRKAFVLYVCWEQINLRGNQVTLEKLEDDEAVVRLKVQFLELYFVAGHLKPKISLEDYKEVFETIWQDRAVQAGWTLDIEYTGDCEVTFRFKTAN